jgi:hypothetical protein
VRGRRRTAVAARAKTAAASVTSPHLSRPSPAAVRAAGWLDARATCHHRTVGSPHPAWVP